MSNSANLPMEESVMMSLLIVWLHQFNASRKLSAACKK
jgi:hypothetical protein